MKLMHRCVAVFSVCPVFATLQALDPSEVRDNRSAPSCAVLCSKGHRACNATGVASPWPRVCVIVQEGA